MSEVQRVTSNTWKVTSRFMDTDSFMVYIKTEDIYVDIVKDVETRSDTSNYMN